MISKGLIIITGLILNMMYSTVHANNFPKGCEPIDHRFIQNYLQINPTGKQTLYLIYNASNNKIELKKQTAEGSFMSPGLNAKLFPNRWAAFASDIKNMRFECQIITRKEQIFSDCADLLTVCQYPRVKFATSNRGNYWVSVNKSLRNTMRDAIRKGILLKW